MPKETVQYPQTDQWSGTELSVNWNKEGGWVQLGLTRHAWTPPEPDAVASVRHGSHTECVECDLAVKKNEDRKAETPYPMSRGDSTDAPPTGEFDPPVTVFTEVLTRNEINRLIRVLRTARDQAYGADA